MKLLLAVGSCVLVTLTACVYVDAENGPSDAAVNMTLKDQTEAIKADGVFFIHADELKSTMFESVWNLPARSLRNSPITGVALDIDIPAGFRAAEPLIFDRTVELLALDGELTIANLDLASGDYLRIPHGTLVSPPTSERGSRVLLFADGGYLSATRSNKLTDAEENRIHLVRDTDSPWVAGTAMADAGRDDVPLRIKHFKNDPVTGARMYLVSVAPGISIPWEIHDVAEEAYIVEGDYTLPECFPTGVEIGNYRKGGYFYRPPGIAHNGPASGSKTGVVMLIRTPGPLKVTLVDGCPPKSM